MGDLDVWVLAGQSNMQGCASLHGALEPQAGVWCFGSDGAWGIAEEPLHRLWESFTPANISLMRSGLSEEDKPLSNAELAQRDRLTRKKGAGLGLAFGSAMNQATGRRIGLIPAAHGGSPLEWWDPQARGQETSLYTAMLQRIRRAGGRLRGLLWYQGESDCLPGLAETYGRRLHAMITALREDVNQPQLPVLAVQLGIVYPEWGPYTHPESYQPGAWNTVREALRELPLRVPHCGVTSAIDLGLCDTIHINTHGLIRLGHRLARLALALGTEPREAGPVVAEAVAVPAPAPGLGRVKLVCRGVSGGWPRKPIHGFEVVSSTMQIRHDVQVINAQADAEEPHCIDLLLSRPVDDDMCLSYGRGLHPSCNATDEADMPLCAFMSQPIDIQ